jgi:hypothetical protein
VSPASDAIENLAARHGVPAPEALEYFLTRLDVRGGDESAAIADVELWAKLWVNIKGDPGPQLKLAVSEVAK